MNSKSKKTTILVAVITPIVVAAITFMGTLSGPILNHLLKANKTDGPNKTETGDQFYTITGNNNNVSFQNNNSATINQNKVKDSSIELKANDFQTKNSLTKLDRTEKKIAQNIIPKIKINFPSLTDSVGTSTVIRGTVTPPNAYVAVFIRPVKLSQFICQGYSNANVGKWSIAAKIGEINKYLNERYEIIAIMSNTPYKKGNVYGTLPSNSTYETIIIEKTKQ